MQRQFLGLLTGVLMLFSCNQKEPTQIQWDEWGVPHITADNSEDLFYAQGWAQMHNHANLILELYGRSRGKAAEYWGEDELSNDVLVHTLGFEELAQDWEAKQDPELRKIYTSFAQGMNAYADAHPEDIDEDKKQVLPITPKDINMHGMYVVFTRFIGGSDLGRVQQWPDMGSNTYAIGPSRSASGKSMLVQNPHLPWWKEFLFFESHLMYGDRNLYGVTLVGFPGIAIGFNEFLGWSHTDNTIDNADTYELQRTETGYLLDGKNTPFETSSKTVKIKQEDGSFKTHEIPLYKTKHGPVVNQSKDKVLALRMVGMDSPNTFLQWWKMINSTNLNEFETALKMGQIPFWNVMYADKNGQIFYLFNGQVPVREQGDWAYWNRIIPGGKSSDIWTEVHSYEDLPKLKNPEIGWLQNANDPPWSSTIPQTLNPKDYPAYMAPEHMYLRPQRSARMLMEDESITFDELIEYKLSTRVELADRLLDDLSKAVEASDSEKAKEAMKVLDQWDRQANAESKGMLLFFNWARKFNIWDHGNFEKPWNAKEPTSTPDGISDTDRAVRLLEQSANELIAGFGRLDVPWGDYYRIAYADKNLPANGIDGSMGVFRVLWPADSNEKNLFAGGGDSWVGVIEFGETPKAKVLLSYGNASQKDSPHFGDQLELFSKKEMRDAWYRKEDYQKHITKTEILERKTE